MSKLTNINSITLNGNIVTKISKTYNQYIRSKQTTLASQEAIEEAINASKKPCNYEFSKQHELNLTKGNIIVKDNYDITYGVHIRNFKDDYFFYKSDDIIDLVLSNIVYISKTIKIFDTNDTYDLRTLSIDYDYNPQISGKTMDITVKSEGDPILFDAGYFNYGSKSLIFTEDSKNYLLSELEEGYAANKSIEGYYSKLYDSDFIAVESGYVLKDDVMLVVNSGCLLTFTENIPDLFETKSAKEGSVLIQPGVNFSSDIVEEMYIDRIQFASFPTYQTTVNMPNLKNIYYSPNLFNCSIDFGQVDVYTNETFRRMGLGQDWKPKIGCKNLHLSSKFFDGIDISTVSDGYFGDWSDTTLTKITTLTIDSEDLYSPLSGDALKNKIKSLLRLNDGIELVVV